MPVAVSVVVVALWCGTYLQLPAWHGMWPHLPRWQQIRYTNQHLSCLHYESGGKSFQYCHVTSWKMKVFMCKCLEGEGAKTLKSESQFTCWGAEKALEQFLQGTANYLDINTAFVLWATSDSHDTIHVASRPFCSLTASEHDECIAYFSPKAMLLCGPCNCC